MCCWLFQVGGCFGHQRHHPSRCTTLRRQPSTALGRPLAAGAPLRGNSAQWQLELGNRVVAVASLGPVLTTCVTVTCCDQTIISFVILDGLSVSQLNRFFVLGILIWTLNQLTMISLHFWRLVFHVTVLHSPVLHSPLAGGFMAKIDSWFNKIKLSKEMENQWISSILNSMWSYDLWC